VNTVELLQYSLDNAFSILGQVTADLTQEQADWDPPGTANGIGALYWHTISSTDYMAHMWCGMGPEPLGQSAGWQERVVLSSAAKGEGPPDIKSVRVDLPLMHEYSRAVGRATKDWLACLTPQDLERVIDTPVGELSLAQVLVTFFIWHIDAHCGEISALKGCQGAKGYPF
jgi:hypothetical protein